MYNKGTYMRVPCARWIRIKICKLLQKVNYPTAALGAPPNLGMHHLQNGKTPRNLQFNGDCFNLLAQRIGGKPR